MPTIQGKRFARRHLPSEKTLYEILEKEQRENNEINRRVMQPKEPNRVCCIVM